MFRSSTVISFRFDGGTQWDVLITLQPPCWCPCTWAPTWRLHTKLYKFGWNTFPNNARKNYRTDLNLGEVVYIPIIFHIPVSWFDLLNGYVCFIFDGVTLQNSHLVQGLPTWNSKCKWNSPISYFWKTEKLKFGGIPSVMRLSHQGRNRRGINFLYNNRSVTVNMEQEQISRKIIFWFTLKMFFWPISEEVLPGNFVAFVHDVVFFFDWRVPSVESEKNATKPRKSHTVPWVLENSTLRLFLRGTSRRYIVNLDN